MTTSFAIAFAVVLGALGGAWHLAAAALRARLLVASPRGPLLGLLTAPLGLLGPLLAVLLQLRLAPEVAWALLPGLLLARLVLTRPLAARLDPRPSPAAPEAP